MYECLLYVCTVGVFMYLCMCVRVCMYVCACVWMWIVCMCVCMYVLMYVCILMFPSLNVAMDVHPRYFKYYWHHRPIRGCGSSNCWSVKFFRFFLNLGLEICTEKIGYKRFAIYLSFGRMPQLSFIITETKNCLFLCTKYKFVLYSII